MLTSIILRKTPGYKLMSETLKPRNDRSLKGTERKRELRNKLATKGPKKERETSGGKSVSPM